jgi:hypothetical protein
MSALLGAAALCTRAFGRSAVSRQVRIVGLKRHRRLTGRARGERSAAPQVERIPLVGGRLARRASFLRAVVFLGLFCYSSLTSVSLSLLRCTELPNGLLGGRDGGSTWLLLRWRTVAALAAAARCACVRVCALLTAGGDEQGVGRGVFHRLAVVRGSGSRGAGGHGVGASARAAHPQLAGGSGSGGGRR